MKRQARGKTFNVSLQTFTNLKRILKLVLNYYWMQYHSKSNTIHFFHSASAQNMILSGVFWRAESVFRFFFYYWWSHLTVYASCIEWFIGSLYLFVNKFPIGCLCVCLLSFNFIQKFTRYGVRLIRLYFVFFYLSTASHKSWSIHWILSIASRRVIFIVRVCAWYACHAWYTLLKYVQCDIDTFTKKLMNDFWNGIGWP